MQTGARIFLFAELAKKWDAYPKRLLFSIPNNCQFLEIDKEDQAVQ